MVQMPLTQAPSEVFNCSQWHFVLYVEYEIIKGQKRLVTISESLLIWLIFGGDSVQS
jgi:hypothetical protein